MTEPSKSLSPSAEEEKISKVITYGLPIVTIGAAAVVGVTIGPATSILVLAAGLILGVISLLWGSLRILTGDAALSPELEALDMAAQGVDTLSSRKKMLVRALKDLENERAIGKLEADDYEPIAHTYREELKVVLKRMDEALAPHRAKAEDAARMYLAKAGIDRADLDETSTNDISTSDDSKDDVSPVRIQCPKCKVSNEVDATFCKKCATSLAAEKKKTETVDDTEDDEDDED